MQVFILMNNLPVYPEVAGVFSSEKKARDWLSVACACFGWTYAEVQCATIEPWFVDTDTRQ